MVIETIDVQSGGTSTAFLNIAQALRTRDDRLRLHAYAQPPPAADPAWSVIRSPGVHWNLTPGVGSALRPGPLGKALAADILARKFALVHIHGLWSPDLLAIARACLRARVPYLWQPHGMLIREALNQKRLKKEVFLALGMRAALSGAGGLVFVTAEERDHSVIPRALSSGSLHVVPLPVATPPMPIDSEFRTSARRRFSVPQDAPAIVFMGRLHPVKRVDMAIDALAALSRLDPALANVRLVLFGGGDSDYQAALAEHARRRSVDDRVVFAGWVQGDDKWRALAVGNVLTLNSLHENFGFVAVEALCVGTFPVLTSNLAIASELVAAGVGASCPPDAERLAHAWAQALRTSAAHPDTVLQTGRAWVDAHLSTHAVGAMFADLYQRVPRPQP